MIWFIVGLVVAIAIIIFAWRNEWYDWGEKISCSIGVLIAFFAISLIVCLIASKITSCCAEVKYNIVSDTKIVALKDNQNVDGNFYILGGYVDEDLYYYYATETEFGYKTEKIKADNAYIKYTDGESHIEKYEGDFVNECTYFWGFPMYDYRYIIYCPKGTVTNEFNVDLE